MEDPVLADELILRLNKLLEQEGVSDFLGRLIESRIRINVPEPTPTQIMQHPETAERTCGFLGILNGVVGQIPDGPKRDWGYIAAYFDDNGKLVRFMRTPEN